MDFARRKHHSSRAQSFYAQIRAQLFRIFSKSSQSLNYFKSRQILLTHPFLFSLCSSTRTRLLLSFLLLAKVSSIPSRDYDVYVAIRVTCLFLQRELKNIVAWGKKRRRRRRRRRKRIMKKCTSETSRSYILKTSMKFD